MRPLSGDEARDVALAGQLRRAMAVRARVDPAAFCQFVLRDEMTGARIKNAPVHAQWHRLVDQHDRLVLWAAVDLGKDLSVDTPVPTPSGWVTMGDLAVGDEVFGRDGRPYPVSFVTPVRTGRTCYRLTFDDQSSIVATDEHRWLAKTPGDVRPKAVSGAHAGDGEPCACGCGFRAKLGRRFVHNHHGRVPLVDGWRVVTTEQMLAAGLTRRSGAKRAAGGNYDLYAWRIPVTAPVEYEERALPVHPYVLGVWLGNGTRGALGVLQHKHVPEAYLLGSVAQRRELLAGLLDADGYGGGEGNGVEFTSTDEPLARGCLELARSLGFKASVAEGRATLDGRDTGPKWRVTFTAHEEVFWSARKRAMHAAAPATPLGARTTYRCVTSIEPVPSVPTRCITVESPDHTYLAGRDYVVTHNTAQLSIGRTLWGLGRDPNRRVVIVTKTANLAQKIMRSVAQYVAKSDALHDVFPGLRQHPDKKLPWNVHQLTVDRDVVAKDPSVQACGIYGNIHGARIDDLVLDDVLDSENTRTRTPREHLWHWVRSTLFGRLTAAARVMVLGNAWHPEDTMHRLAKEPGFVGHRSPVYEVSDRGETKLAWPEHWPWARIERARTTDMGPFEFARALLCQARDDESARFKRDHVDACCARGVGLRCLRTAEELYDELLEKNPEWADQQRAAQAARLLGDAEARGPLDLIGFFTGVDLAFSKKDSADLTCIFTGAVFPNGDRRVLEVESGRWTAPETLEKVESAHERYNSVVMVESVGAQKGILDILSSRSSIPVVPYNTGASTRLEYVVEAVAVEFMNHKWVIPSGVDGKQRSREVDLWIGDLFGYDASAHTPDRVAAMCFMRECARLYDARRAGNVGVRVISAK